MGPDSKFSLSPIFRQRYFDSVLGKDYIRCKNVRRAKLLGKDVSENLFVHNSGLSGKFVPPNIFA